MIKTKNGSDAADMAAARGQFHGVSCFDGFYYVGTREELRGVGAPVIEQPGLSKEARHRVSLNRAVDAIAEAARSADDVRESLIEHDGYPADIKVFKVRPQDNRPVRSPFHDLLD